MLLNSWENAKKTVGSEVATQIHLNLFTVDLMARSRWETVFFCFMPKYSKKS